MPDDQQILSESLDPDELGDDPSANFPPERSVGVDDPTRDDHVVDSVAERADRELPELDVLDDAEGIRLAAPNDVLADDESEATATALDADDLTAEEAAIHIVDEDPT